MAILPALPFLDQQAVTLTAPDAVTQRIAEQLPLRGLLHGPSASNLSMRNIVLRLGGLSIAGSAHTPLCLEMDPLPGVVTLAFSEQGSADLAVDGTCHRMAPRDMALFIPSCEFRCESKSIVSVLIHDSASNLTAAAAALAGPGAQGDTSQRYRLQRPILVDGSEDHPRTALLASLRRSLRLLDQPALLAAGAFEALQLEDLLRRHLALLLWPALLTPQPPVADQGGRDAVLEQLLEWMDAHHPEPITLTDLARRSGDSVRNLQYRFRRRVGCSPMQWLQRRRLAAAYADLQRAAGEESVATIARRHGFHHLSGFAASFRREYGRLPSQVRRESRLDW